MKSLVQGQNTALSGNAIQVSVAWTAVDVSATIDVSAFLLNDAGKVRSDDDMIFYGQPASADGSVSIASDTPRSDGGDLAFALDTSRVATDVERIAFTATTSAATSPPLSTVKSLEITVTAPEGDPCLFTVETQNAPEAAMILGELYRRGDAWKFRAVGQGFVGGLAPLAEHFGVVVDDPGTSEPGVPQPPEPAAVTETPAAPPLPTPAAVTETPAAPTPSASPAPPVTAEPAVSLSKVSLSKAKPSISLEKRGATLGEIRINLNWNQKIEGKGIFGQRKDTSVDLDLCCLFALKDGGKGAVQALGENFGSYDLAPWIHLLGDDRTGGISDGEWLKVNGGHWDSIERIVIFALIYKGVPNWASTDGVVTLHLPDQPLVESRMDGESNHRVCAVAALENDNGRLKITQENRYFKSAKELDEHYGVGLSWTAGRK